MCNERCRAFDTIQTACPYRTYQSILGETGESGMISWGHLLSSFCITYLLYNFTFIVFQCCNLVLLQHHICLKDVNMVNPDYMLQVGICVYGGMVSIKTHISSIINVVLSMRPLVTSKEILLCRNKYYKIGKNRESLDPSKRNRNKDILESTRAYIQSLLRFPQSFSRIFSYPLFAR